MRFFLLLLAAANVQGDSHLAACDGTCVEAIYQKIAEVPSELGYVEGDMAVYGYLLYHAYVTAAGAGAAGTAGFEFVDNALEVWMQSCELETPTAAGMTTCIGDATAADIDEVKAWLDGAQPDGAGDDKPYYEAIIGGISNQLAPDSLAAAAWDGLTEDEFDMSLYLFYVVGSYFEWIVPTVAKAYPLLGTEEVGSEFSELANACFMKIGAAVGVTGEDGENMAEKIATNGDKAFGADGVLHATCLGNDAIDFTGGLKVTIRGTEVSFADKDALTAAATTEGTTTQATVARLEAAGQPAKAADPSDTSSAAALSALVAAIALML